MIILHIVDVANPLGNGVISAVSNYLKYENEKCDVALFNVGANTNECIDNNIKYFEFSTYKSIENLPFPFNNPDIIIFNEVYKLEYIKLYNNCLKKDIPYVIIPHGCLVNGAQKQKKIKKILGNFLLFNRFITNASAIQFLNIEEKSESQFKCKKSFISGNGVEIQHVSNSFTNKNFIFIGRYDYFTKGLDLIINTVKDNRKWFLDNCVKIVLYGRNSGRGYDKISKLICNNDLNEVIELNGEIYGIDKRKELLQSYCFVQVSRHEGQPIGIMEALSYGLPCIATFGTKFGNLINKYNCGIGIEFDRNQFFYAIKKMYTDENFRNICSKNALKFIKKYDWREVIDKCLDEYKELL